VLFRSTMMSLGINPKNVPILPAFGVWPALGHLGILEEAERRKVELLVWEGFGRYVESNAGSSTVARWLSYVTWRLSHFQDGSPRFAPLTIIGVMEQPKMKPKDRYENARQRISGPAAWGHSASTIVLVEHSDLKCKGPGRNLEIYPRDSGDILRKATLATGHFVIVP